MAEVEQSETNQFERRQRRGRDRLMLLPFLMLPLLCALMFCASQIGLHLSISERLGVEIVALETADYRPWNEATKFAPVDPRLGTLVAELSPNAPLAVVIIATTAAPVANLPTPASSEAAASATTIAETAQQAATVAASTNAPDTEGEATSAPEPTETDPERTATIASEREATETAAATEARAKTATAEVENTAQITPTDAATSTPDNTATAATATLTSTLTATIISTTAVTPSATPITPTATSVFFATATPTTFVPTVIPPPVAGINAVPGNGQAPLTVTFYNTSSGSITTYDWNFGDGTTATGTGPHVRTYNTSANYFVTLTVSGPGGTNSTSTAVTVFPPPAPTATNTAVPPTVGPTFTPTRTPSPTLLPAQVPLVIVPLCSVDPATTLRWRINSNNPYTVNFNWVISGTGHAGSNTTPAGSPGQRTITTTTQPGANTLVVSVAGLQNDSEPANTTPCSVNTPTHTPTVVPSDTPVPFATFTNTPIPPPTNTDTPIPPTNTDTPIPPTDTPIPPTNTDTPIPPSDTPVPSLETIIIDNLDAGVVIVGAWPVSTMFGGFHASNYIRDDNVDKGTKSVQYIPNLAGGTYEVFAWYPAHSSRATNTPYTVNHAAGNNIVSVNQQINGGMWWSLGTFTFNPGTGGSVTITTGGTNGYVIADAVRFVQISF